MKLGKDAEDAMRALGLGKDDALVLYGGNGFDANFYRLTGTEVMNSFYLLTAHGQTMICPQLEYRGASEDFRGTVICSKKPLEELKRLLPHSGRIALDMRKLSASAFVKLGLGGRAHDASEALSRLRTVKTGAELQKIRRAVHATKKILQEFDPFSFSTEKQASDWLISKAYSSGYEPAYPPIVSSGRNTCRPHHVPGMTHIGRSVLVDFGLRHAHYCSDLTRMYFCNSTSPGADGYEKLKHVLHEVADRAPQFRHSGELAAFSANLMKKQGFPEMVHAFGHGIGLDVHEFPRIGIKYHDSLDGSVFAFEPAFYLKSHGARFEECMHISKGKCEIL
jgi:Xaa-Pro aminopeptidase